jgi:hypothetical protein
MRSSLRCNASARLLLRVTLGRDFPGLFTWQVLALELGSRSVHVVNNSTDQKAFDEILKRLREWDRWQLVDSTQADVLLVFSDRFTNYGSVGSFVGGTGTVIPMTSNQLFLTLVDPLVQENVLVISCEKRFGAGRNASVLVNRLRDRIEKDESTRK